MEAMQLVNTFDTLSEGREAMLGTKAYIGVPCLAESA